MRACSLGVRTVGFDPRCCAINPSSRFSAKRRFHNAIVRELQPVWLVIDA